MIKAVIFDLDGVIIDSEQHWFQLNKNFLLKEGFNVEDKTVYKTIGGSMDYLYNFLFSFYDKGKMTMSRLRYDYDKYCEKDEVKVSSLVDKDAEELLRNLKENNIKIALASASSLEYIRNVLKEAGIFDYFDVIVSGELFKENKPAPDVYLCALKKLGLSREECLVVEDSQTGISAAKNAGIKVAGVKGFGNQDLSLSDYPLNGLKEVYELTDYLNNDSDKLVRIFQDNKEYVLIPVAHVSRNSAVLTERACKYEKPDSICVELDKDRYKSLTDKNKWQNTDIGQIIKQRKVAYFLVNLLLASYQKRMAKNLNSSSGNEMLEGIKQAEKQNIPLVLADRSVSVTFTRVWRLMKGKDRIKLISSLFGSLFEEDQISEEDLAKLEEKDELTAALAEVEKELPFVSSILVTERDKYLAHKIKQAPGNKVIAVLGAAHTIGIQNWIKEDYSIEELDYVPPKKKTGKIIGVILGVLFMLMMFTLFRKNPDVGKAGLLNWIIWHALLAALGGLLSLAHPLTTLCGLVLSPFTSLGFPIGCGFIAGLLEAKLRKPQVRDFENLAEDANSLKGFYRNKVTRTLLVVILINLGSSIATIFVGIDIVASFIGIFR